jgi:ABC-2 type transport system ATP-binding protein
MNEMAVTADHLIVIGKGRLVADCSTEEFIERHNIDRSVLVRTPDPERLETALKAAGATVTRKDSTGELDVTGLDAPRIGDLALAAGIALHELTPQRGSLEEAFMELTRESVEYGAGLPEANR